jgi:Protein of unknown function (DUF3014)
MNENIKWMAAAVAVVGLSIGAVFYLSSKDDALPVEAPVAAEPAPPPEEPGIKHPLPAPDAEQAMPLLADSDGAVGGALGEIIGKGGLEQFVITRDLVRNIVVTIDNLSTEKVAERIRPLKPVPGAFAAGGSEDAPVLDAANYERYQALVQLVQSTDTQALVATYQRYYPLFQEAYESLGHPPQYFNDRVIEVIDHLLATPEVQGTIALSRPGMLYEFADPKLESQSAGQKVLTRMGTDNARAIKAKLTELRGALTARPPG